MNPHKRLITGISTTKLTNEEKTILQDIQPGGVILFGRNIESQQQLADLIAEIYDILKTPLIAIDQEGGRVARLREIGVEPPSALELRTHGNTHHITQHGKLTGQLLQQWNINLDLCPVVDLSYQGDQHNSLKNRTWGEDFLTVIQNAQAFITGLQQSNVLCCAKHFPSYSQAKIDPHHQLPTMHPTYEEMRNNHWQPYIQLKDHYDSIMVGHAFYPHLDNSGVPSSLSKKINNYIREDVGFEGVVVSDDLDMGAIIENYDYKEAVDMALKAGNDLLLLCHQFDKLELAANVAQQQSKEENEASLHRIDKLLSRVAPFTTTNFSIVEQINQETFELRASLIGAEKAKQHSPEDANRSPVEDF
ncbi:glycoside hydrolase family 3 N-terminal domain-containing protein [Candidatus Uabimicrobium amorphum]|uniref:beta-N-acetylhexosaminidase n=1 Tax=Uabimicrobium amorphum TaxID=2596890 RepID=A0A5S9IQ13_UABAM|nr:glycoside hydrolase family 3 N-terminal domain-containing protein [Candidatus Uabimicrobium amorphum]BBM85342.1 glycosyl hydrolase [Candidatus Uabimicrobium amorphum]